LGLEDIYINNLFEDCSDGLVLLRVLDHIQPGIVSWRQVEMKPTNKFKKVSNCNYVVVLGKQLKFSLVNIAGPDIVGGNKKLILALVWQMMRAHTLKFLAAVQAKKFGGAEVTDEVRGRERTQRRAQQSSTRVDRRAGGELGGRAVSGRC